MSRSHRSGGRDRSNELNVERSLVRRVQQRRHPLRVKPCLLVSEQISGVSLFLAQPSLTLARVDETVDVHLQEFQV